jgi:hypothetical protein
MMREIVSSSLRALTDVSGARQKVPENAFVCVVVEVRSGRHSSTFMGAAMARETQ